jgi:uncharacterized protein (DUF885 family)
MKLQFIKSVIIAGLILLVFIQADRNSAFSALKEDFHKGYLSLGIPELRIDYAANLRSIKSATELVEQERFFEHIHSRWMAIDVQNLYGADLLDHQIMGYEITLNKERLALESKWDPKTTLDANKSIYSIPNGKEWYAYLLKKWVDLSVTPEELYEFGASEIKKVKANMRQIQLASGLSEDAFETYLKGDRFLITDPEKVQRAFEEVKKRVARKAPQLFPYLDRIPDVVIDRGSNAALAHAPAYYNNNTFYYNLFDKPFNSRQLGWFYAHEAIPGHHYQSALNRVVKRSEIQELFWYPGFVEGWGAYVEHLGEELDAYTDIYDQYGKWEWDLIRSVRVCLDIGINYRGWSDEKALAFWSSHIKDQEDIANREISRMKRWPAQVITYKFGEAAILSMRDKAKEQEGFSLKDFHRGILQHGDIPISILLDRQDRNWD